MGLMKRGNRRKRTYKYHYPQKFQSIRASNAPFSYVEAYKSLRTNLDFVSSASGVKSILIASAVPDESKSTVAINLAITLADSGSSVIIVECDLRKPELRKYLKLAGESCGLSSVLAGKALQEESIVRVEDLGFSVLLAGAIPPNPSELLHHDKMNQLIQDLKQKYDYVILDAPPVTVVTDAAVVGRMTDGALLVVRSKFASAKTIRMAKQKLESVDIKILGAVITRFDVNKAGWRTGYNYKSYEYGYAQNRRNDKRN